MTRRGYTFIELLLVLAILAALAGLAWPSVVRFSSEQSIKDAAERVRSELDRTRFRAIDAGLAYQFRYEPNGRRFIAVPAERDLTQAANTNTAGPMASLPAFSGEIAEGLTFQPVPGAPLAAEMISADWLAGLSDGVLLGQARWSSPVFYRPDGTGTAAAFRVTDENEQFIELSIRELTGIATAGPLRKEAGL
ncbi:MAG: prepilin-type N-terminal cleavage/methylation domain-containing protein [Planctomycetaceae bacterium]